MDYSSVRQESSYHFRESPKFAGLAKFILALRMGKSPVAMWLLRATLIKDWGYQCICINYIARPSSPTRHITSEIYVLLTSRFSYWPWPRRGHNYKSFSIICVRARLYAYCPRLNLTAWLRPYVPSQRIGLPRSLHRIKSSSEMSFYSAADSHD